MKALVLIGVILSVTAFFSSAGAHKRKRSGVSESSEEHFKLPKQLSPKLLRGHFAKSQRAPGNPCGHHGRPEPLRGHHPQSPHGPPPRAVSPPENTVNLQASSAPSSAAPTLISTTAPAAAATSASAASAGKTAGPSSNTPQPEDITPHVEDITPQHEDNTPQPEDITNAPAADTITAPVANATTVNQQQELQ